MVALKWLTGVIERYGNGSKKSRPGRDNGIPPRVGWVAPDQGMAPSPMKHPHGGRRALAIIVPVVLAIAGLGSASCVPTPTVTPAPTATPRPTPTMTPSVPQQVRQITVRTLRGGAALAVVVVAVGAVLLWKWPGLRGRANSWLRQQRVWPRVRRVQRLVRTVQVDPNHGLTLAPKRQALATNLAECAAHLERGVEALPYDSIRAVSEILVVSLHRLVSEAESSLNLAQWLWDEVSDLDGTDERTTEPTRTALSEVRDWIADLENRVRGVCDVLKASRVQLMVAARKQDEGRIAAQIAALNARLVDECDALRKVNESLRGL
jgi:hypothetical protein